MTVIIIQLRNCEHIVRNNRFLMRNSQSMLIVLMSLPMRPPGRPDFLGLPRTVLSYVLIQIETSVSIRDNLLSSPQRRKETVRAITSEQVIK